MNATAQRKATRTLLERYRFAQEAGCIDIDENGGVVVDKSANDPNLADDLVAALPAQVLAAGHGVIIGALGGLNSPR